VLINDKVGSVAGSTTYFEYVLLTFAPVYRPEDVYITELFGGLSQLERTAHGPIFQRAPLPQRRSVARVMDLRDVVHCGHPVVQLREAAESSLM